MTYRNKGRPLTEKEKEDRRKSSETRTGSHYEYVHIMTEEHKKKISDALSGKSKSEEHKKHLSEYKSGRAVPGAKGKHNQLKGRKQSPEFIAKRFAAIKKNKVERERLKNENLDEEEVNIETNKEGIQ